MDGQDEMMCLVLKITSINAIKEMMIMINGDGNKRKRKTTIKVFQGVTTCFQYDENGNKTVGDGICWQWVRKLLKRVFRVSGRD